MPIYPYRCDACGKASEVWAKMSDPPPEACPKCGGGPLHRAVARTAFHLKGGGWYAQGYGAGGSKGKEGGDGEAKGGEVKGEAKGAAVEGKSESKSAESTGGSSDSGGSSPGAASPGAASEGASKSVSTDAGAKSTDAVAGKSTGKPAGKPTGSSGSS